MPTPTLVATAGAANANSYTTVAEADAYHDAHFYGSVWADAETASKIVTLIWATRLLDEQHDWKGEKVTATQALRWPRYDAEDCDGFPIDATTIPLGIKNATAELARHLLVKDRLQEMDDNVAGLKSVQAGSVSVEFSSMDRIDLFPPSVDQMLRCFTSAASASGMIVPLERA